MSLKWKEVIIIPKFFVTSDIHSFYTPLKKALDEAGFDPNNKEHLTIFQQTAILIKSMSELGQVPVMDDEGNVSESSGIAAGKVLKVLNNELH